MLKFIPTVLVILSSKFYDPVTNRGSLIKWLKFEYFHYEVNATSCNDVRIFKTNFLRKTRLDEICISSD